MKIWLKISLVAMAALSSVTLIQAEGWGPDTELPSTLESFALEGDVPALQGKVTLIDFWASWCAPCKAAFPEMEKLYQKFKDEGFQIVAVSVDQKANQMQRFLDKQKPSFATPHDAAQQMVKVAEIEVMPSSFLVDRKGIIRFAHEGWHGKESVESLTNQIQELLAE